MKSFILLSLILPLLLSCTSIQYGDAKYTRFLNNQSLEGLEIISPEGLVIRLNKQKSAVDKGVIDTINKVLDKLPSMTTP